jgi:hypothetical protein
MVLPSCSQTKTGANPSTIRKNHAAVYGRYQEVINAIAVQFTSR